MMFSRTTTISLCLTLAILLNCMSVDVEGLIDKRWDQTAVSRAGPPTISDFCKGLSRELATANRVELLRDDEELSKLTCEAAGYCWDYDRSSVQGLSPCYSPQPQYRGHTCQVPEKYRVRQRAYTGGYLQCFDVGGCYEPGPRHAPYCFYPKIWHNNDVDDTPTDLEYCKGRTFRSWASDAPGGVVANKADCESKGYCWDPARPRHMGGPHFSKCFTPLGDATSCAIPENERIRAAFRSRFMKTTRTYCEDLGHCFVENADGTSLCYHAKIKDIIDAKSTAATEWRAAYKAERERIYNSGHVP